MSERCVVVLVVGEERSWRDETARILRRDGYVVAPWSSGDPADILRHVVADILLIDVSSLGAMLALDAISSVRRAQPSIKVVCVSDTPREATSLRTLCGAHVAKSSRHEFLLAQLRRSLHP